MKRSRAVDRRWGGIGADARRRRRERRLRPTLWALEQRALLSTTITVDNLTDTPAPGQTDLRQAIARANMDGGG